MTFLQETKVAVNKSGHKIQDVMFVGSKDGKFRLCWGDFRKIADFGYDDGYGGQEIAQDLIVYFWDNSYMVRGEYDGSEWWEYNEPLIYNECDISSKYDSLCAQQSEKNGHTVKISYIGSWSNLSLINGIQESKDE